MSDPVNMHEAKTELSRLVERALAGEGRVRPPADSVR
jgi:antitoxin (DNA-binding transcriptional repressor) of toxin-antitoxin stability system